MRHGAIFLLGALFNAAALQAQVSINTSNTAADSSAMLDVFSTSRGLLIPRMTAEQRDSILYPATGLLIFCTGDQQFYCNKGTPANKSWKVVNTQWNLTGYGVNFLDGDVGIGIVTTSAKLHVVGNSIFNGNASVTGKLSTPASSSSGAGIILPHGSAPSSPANGDIWTTTGGLYARINGATIGPFGTGNGNGSVTAVTATTPILSSGGTVPDISIPKASWTADGYLSASDWYNFYSKVGSVTATLPLSSSGGQSPNLSIPQSSSSASGYLSAADWSAFNGKESALTFNSPLSRAVNTISLPAASASVNGYLSSGDYSRIHGTTGSMLFFDGSGIQQNNSSLFWDNSNSRLGILTSSPSATLSIGSSGQFQVASTGSCSVTLSSTAGAITAKNTNSSGFGTISYGQNTSAFDQSTPSGGAFKGSTYGVYGEAVYNASGARFGGYFYTRKSETESSYAFVGGYLSGTAKTIYGPGYTSLCLPTPYGGMVDMFGQVTPEVLMNDYGTGKLVNGRCHIDIDPIFASNIISTEEHPLKVFIQPEGDCNGVYVTHKSVTGFDVIELKGGTSCVPFSWSVVANRKDIINKDGSVSSKHVGIRFPKSPLD